MARFIPTVPDSFNGSKGEEDVFQALRLLDNGYTIFHSLRWVGINNRTQGEADFVIIHPARGIMVIEVKSGGIEYSNGKWIQTNTSTGYSKTISPFTQAQRNQFEILERLQSSLRLGRPPLACHAVWFPSIKLKLSDKFPPDAPRVIVFDEITLNESKKAIDSAFEFWAKKLGIKTNMDNPQFNEVIETLAPYFKAVPGMKYIVEEAEQSYIRLTNQQSILLDYLQEQKTAVIHGLAGTGKTVLAKEKAQRLANEDEKVLFLCFNNFLKEHLKKSFSQPGVTFHTAHSLAVEILNDSSIGLNELINALEEYIALIDPEEWPYNHVVIDEGQDLSEDLITYLYELITKKGGNFYVFYDRNQYVMKNSMPGWFEKAECKLMLHSNCRNTAEIFKTSCSMIAFDSTISDNSVHGEKPNATLVNSKSELINTAVSFVKKSIDAGIRLDDIVFLTVETEAKSLLNGVARVGNYNISSEREVGKILFTSVRKFKGLEAKAVLIIDLSISALTTPEKQRLTYVGCSRAKHLLHLAITNDTGQNDIGYCLKQINPTRNVPKNIKGLGRLLNISIK